MDMAKKVSKYFIEKTTGTEDVGEIDFDLYNELFTVEGVDKIWDSDKSPSEFIIDNRTHYSEGHPIKISRLKEIIDKIEKEGANYIALNYHCDHIGYEIEGVSIQEATEKEINNHLNEIAARNEKENRRAELYKELEEL